MPTYGRVKVDTITYDLSGTATDVSVSNIATKASPTFTGTVTIPTPTAGDNSTKAASTAFVVASFATKASPTFTGTINAADLVLSGDLTVNGSTTTIDTTTLQVEDKNIQIGKVSTPSDVTADGGGLTLLGATNKTWNWVNSTDAWTSSEHIHLGDNKKLLVGTGSDLQIYHDGSNSWIEDAGTGVLGIKSNSFGVKSANGSESMAWFTEGGSVDLYHNNSKKLETTSSGINVTGQINVNGSALSTAPQITATADGDIAAGDPIIVKSDGDVKKVGLAITVLNPPTVSTDKTLITTNNLVQHQLLWIPSLNKFILGFSNDDSGDDFEVVVGEVDDAGAFTWGSIVQVEAGYLSKEPAFAYDTNSNKLVCVWRDNTTENIRSAVGTISGNSISFGTVVTIETSMDAAPTVCFDSTNNKVVAVYKETSTGYAKSAVGTVSGTDISWGTAVDVNSHATALFSAAYDPDTQRVLFVEKKVSGEQLNSYVGTVSGTSISWGSATEIVSTGDWVRVVYDTENNKAVVGYTTTNNTASAKVGTVTGGSTNSISWGSAGTWWNSGNMGAAKITYDDYTKRVIVQMRRDTPPSNQQYLHIASGGVSGTSITFTNDATQTNVTVWGTGGTALCMAQKGQIISVARHGSLDQDTYSWRGLAGTGATDLTTENYVGLAAAAANDNATATVDVSGATNTSQSSLTPGQKYFVQGDGTLGLTADTPKVYAGTAISATKLIVNDAPEPYLASSGAYVKLASGSVTDGQNILVTNDLFTSTYFQYKILFFCNTTSGSPTTLGIQFTKDGGSNWIEGSSGDYRYTSSGRLGSTNLGNNNTGNQGNNFMFGNSYEQWHGEITITKPSSTSTIKSANFVGTIMETQTSYYGGTLSSNVAYRPASNQLDAVTGIRFTRNNSGGLALLEWSLIAAAL